MFVLEPGTPCRVQTAAHEDHLPVGLKEPLPRCSEALSPRHPSSESAVIPHRSACPCSAPDLPLSTLRGLSCGCAAFPGTHGRRAWEGDVLEVACVFLRGPAYHGGLPRDKAPTAPLWV